MGVTACDGLDCLGAALVLGPLRRSLDAVSSGPGTALEPIGILLNASGLRCGLRPIGPASPRGLASWCPRRSS
jgi:hypothetical protein